MSAPRWIDEKEYARIRGCALGTIRNERWRGTGCPYYKVGGSQVRYRQDEVIAWLESFRVGERREVG